MEQTVISPIEMGREISELGFMIVASACFLFTSVITYFFLFRGYARFFNSFVNAFQQTQQRISESLQEVLYMMKEKEFYRLLEEQAERQKEQTRMLEEIREKVFEAFLRDSGDCGSCPQ